MVWLQEHYATTDGKRERIGNDLVGRTDGEVGRLLRLLNDVTAPGVSAPRRGHWYWSDDDTARLESLSPVGGIDVIEIRFLSDDGRSARQTFGAETPRFASRFGRVQ